MKNWTARMKTRIWIRGKYFLKTLLLSFEREYSKKIFRERERKIWKSESSIDSLKIAVQETAEIEKPIEMMEMEKKGNMFWHFNWHRFVKRREDNTFKGFCLYLLKREKEPKGKIILFVGWELIEFFFQEFDSNH